MWDDRLSEGQSGSGETPLAAAQEEPLTTESERGIDNRHASSGLRQGCSQKMKKKLSRCACTAKSSTIVDWRSPEERAQPSVSQLRMVARQTQDILNQLRGWKKVSLQPTSNATELNTDGPNLVNISNSSYTCLNFSSTEAQAILKNISMLGRAIDSGISVDAFGKTSGININSESVPTTSAKSTGNDNSCGMDDSQSITSSRSCEMSTVPVRPYSKGSILSIFKDTSQSLDFGSKNMKAHVDQELQETPFGDCTSDISCTNKLVELPEDHIHYNGCQLYTHDVQMANEAKAGCNDEERLEQMLDCGKSHSEIVQPDNYQPLNVEDSDLRAESRSDKCRSKMDLGFANVVEVQCTDLEESRSKAFEMMMQNAHSKAADLKQRSLSSALHAEDSDLSRNCTRECFSSASKHVKILLSSTSSESCIKPLGFSTEASSQEPGLTGSYANKLTSTPPIPSSNAKSSLESLSASSARKSNSLTRDRALEQCKCDEGVERSTVQSNDVTRPGLPTTCQRSKSFRRRCRKRHLEKLQTPRSLSPLSSPSPERYQISHSFIDSLDIAPDQWEGEEYQSEALLTSSCIKKARSTSREKSTKQFDCAGDQRASVPLADSSRRCRRRNAQKSSVSHHNRQQAGNMKDLEWSRMTEEFICKLRQPNQSHSTETSAGQVYTNA